MGEARPFHYTYPQNWVVSPGVKKRLLELAHGRNDGKAPAQSRKKTNWATDLQTDFVGLTGEHVASGFYGVPFKAESYGAGGDDGIDLVVNGVSCAVKTNHRRGGYLLVEFEKELEKAEALVLVDGYCDPPRFCACNRLEMYLDTPDIWRVVGWLPVPVFREIHRASDWGHGKRLWVPQAELWTEYLCRESLSKARA
jgi:hypothetical protein